MTNARKQLITKILINHPEYTHRWKNDHKQVRADLELGLYLFMRASEWTDNIKVTNYHKCNVPSYPLVDSEGPTKITRGRFDEIV